MRFLAIATFICCVFGAAALPEAKAQILGPGPQIPIPRIKLPGMKSVELAKPFPGFTLTDANGKTWRTADLKGKVTYIMLWSYT